jgi:serine/threonine-protein kinase
MAVEADQGAYDKLIGQVLANRYQIETRLGEGAMGAVYRAKHVKVGRAFAVKLLHSRLLMDDKVLQRFEREAELAGRLRHPNVIGVVDVGETPDGLRYMVMDFAEGPDLATVLSEAPMPPQRVTTLTRQMLEGLYHAHEQGLIHRDFKPENVIIERGSHGEEVPRIVDFGIAILREGGDSVAGPGRLTTNGLVLGTPHYMAPEQAVADPIDHRIDLFALGIIVYEMLCGKLPFDGTGAEVARANLLLDPPLISERVPYLDVDPLLEAFARRMMAKKRDLRPATAKVARELLDLIEKDREAAAAALGVPLSAAREPMATQPQAPIRPHTTNDTFPPPIREALATPPQAPPMKGVVATPASAPRHVSTDSTAPVKRRNTPLIAAAVIGFAVLGGAAAVIINGGEKKKEPVAVVEQMPEQAPAPVVTPATPVEAQAPVVEEKTDPPVEEAKTPVVEEVKKTAVEEPKKTVEEPKKAVTKTKTQKVATKTSDAVVTPPVVEKTPEKPVVVETPKVVDANALVAQYKSVGKQLKALEDAKGAGTASDLWARYRIIRIADAMSTQPKRDEASAILAKLIKEIAARK